MSNFKSISAGVPQGFVLGPFLFLLFINDITHEINTNVKLFADDTSLYVIVDEDVITPTNDLNDDLESIYNWAKLWKIHFNPQKIVALSGKKRYHPPLIFNNQIINEHVFHKHLGVIFDSNGSWGDHIKYIYDTSCKRLNILRMLKH